MDKKELKEVGLIPTGLDKFKAKPTEEIAEHIIQELEDLLVERNKAARENTMLAFWETGELLRKTEKDHKLNISALVNRIAMDNRVTGRQMGERNLWFAIKVYDTYPKFEKLYETEHGQNITLSKVKKMLITSKGRVEKTVLQMAIDIVHRLGTEKAAELAEKILKEVEKEEKKNAKD